MWSFIDNEKSFDQKDGNKQWQELEENFTHSNL